MLVYNYYLDDNWSVEFKADVPPTVDIMGKGQVFSPFTGDVDASGIGSVLPEFAIKKDIPITDLEQGNGVASTARAWLPAASIQYQFGQSGVNKFRPYVVAGVIYAYFNDIDLNDGIRQDLERAGDQIQNIKDNKAGAALENVKSSSDMRVNVEADSAFAPILTVGATYALMTDGSAWALCLMQNSTATRPSPSQTKRVKISFVPSLTLISIHILLILASAIASNLLVVDDQTLD